MLNIFIQFFSKALPATLGNPTEAFLGRLDDSALKGVFDSFNVSELINTARLSPRYEKAVEEHILSKYHWNERKVMVAIGRSIRLQYNNFSEHGLITGEKDEVLYALQHFGHVFKYIEIDIIAPGNREMEEVQALVNTYCINAFIKVTLFTVPEYYRLGDNKVNVYVSRAKSIHLHHDTSALGYYPPYPLNESFPLMEYLTVSRETDLEGKFPNFFLLKKASFYGNFSNIRTWKRIRLIIFGRVHEVKSTIGHPRHSNSK